MTKQKFIQFFDVNTDPDNFSVFTVKAGGPLVRQRLGPFFSAYKYYKLGRVNVKCVPASTLPVDPTGLSYEAGESTVDPRDQFNPGLVRITNGEDVDSFNNIDMNKYYATMLDRRWYKFRLQGGFSRSAVPLVWNVAQNHQSAYPGHTYLSGDGSASLQPLLNVEPSVSNVCIAQDTVLSGSWLTLKDSDGLNVAAKQAATTASGAVSVKAGDTSSAVGSSLYSESEATAISIANAPYMMQNQRVRLGWMPTDIGGPSELYATGEPGHIAYNVGYAPIPEVDLMTFILPKAFKTKFYYRIFIESTVYFKDPVVIDPFQSASAGVPIDRFSFVERLPNTNDYPEASS